LDADDQIEARTAGRKAAQLAMAGSQDGSIVFKRAKGPKYKISYVRAELKDVARLTRNLPANFINKTGNGIAGGYVKYAMPPVGKLPELGKLF